jgi:hypothetical protein
MSDKIDSYLHDTRPITGIHIWEGAESSLSKICAMINEDRRFIDGLVEVGKLFIGRKMDEALQREINAAINQYIAAWFREYTNPGWTSDCRYEYMGSSIDPQFKTISGETIDAYEAQRRIDKHGWRLRLFEEERARRFA